MPLWESANILRGAVDAADFKTYIFPLLFFKRICDVRDEENEGQPPQKLFFKTGDIILAKRRAYQRKLGIAEFDGICQNLLKWRLFNLCVGNNDSHAKNISMLQTSEGERLAPFYDLMCTAVYPGFSANFAFKIGGTFRAGEIGPGELKALADSLNVSERYMLKLAEDMSDRISPAMDLSMQELQNSLGQSENIMAARLGRKVSSICKRRRSRFLARSTAPTSPAPASTVKKRRMP